MLLLTKHQHLVKTFVEPTVAFSTPAMLTQSASQVHQIDIVSPRREMLVSFASAGALVLLGRKESALFTKIRLSERSELRIFANDLSRLLPS